MPTDNSFTPKCDMCGKPTERPLWLDGLPYHSGCANGPGGPLRNETITATAQAKPLTEEDVRRIVREEMAAMWRSQTTGAKVNS